MNFNPESNMRKSELHKLWDDHVAASVALQTRKLGDGETIETLQQRVKRTKRAYEEFLRTGKVRR